MESVCVGQSDRKRSMNFNAMEPEVLAAELNTLCWANEWEEQQVKFRENVAKSVPMADDG